MEWNIIEAAEDSCVCMSGSRPRYKFTYGKSVLIQRILRVITYVFFVRFKKIAIFTMCLCSTPFLLLVVPNRIAVLCQSMKRLDTSLEPPTTNR